MGNILHHSRCLFFLSFFVGTKIHLCVFSPQLIRGSHLPDFCWKNYDSQSCWKVYERNCELLSFFNFLLNWREYIKRCFEPSSTEIYFGFVPSWEGMMSYLSYLISKRISNDMLTFLSISRWICFSQQMLLKRVSTYLTVLVWYALTFPELFVAMSSLVGVPEEAVRVMFLWLRGTRLPHLSFTFWYSFFLSLIGYLALKRFSWSLLSTSISCNQA